jgi:hypothetical protein
VSLIKRFSNQTLCIGLNPEQLSCVLRRGKVFAIDHAYLQTVSSPDGHWQPVLAACQAWLREADRASAGLPLRFTLSSRWCRMMSVPWSDALLSAPSAQRFLQTQFMSLYGDVARDWVVTCDDAPYGEPRMACAIERDLLEALQQAAAENMHPLHAIESVIPVAWRAIAAKDGRSDAIAVIEPGRITLARVRKRRLVALQSQPFLTSWQQELPQAWQRWALRDPELTGITEVAVLNLTGETASATLPKPFHAVLLPSYGLASGYSFITCGNGS